MSHTPFIVGAYLISAVLLFWTAIAPVLNKRNLLRQLKTRQTRMEE